MANSRADSRSEARGCVSAIAIRGSAAARIDRAQAGRARGGRDGGAAQLRAAILTESIARSQGKSLGERFGRRILGRGEKVLDSGAWGSIVPLLSFTAPCRTEGAKEGKSAQAPVRFRR